MERDVGNKLGVRKRFDVGPKHLPTKHLSPIRDAIACGQIVGGKLDDSGTRFLHARPPPLSSCTKRLSQRRNIPFKIKVLIPLSPLDIAAQSTPARGRHGYVCP
jgi:hypothetical protein